MIRTLTLSAAMALGLSAGPVAAAGGEGAHIENVKFSFDGPFGTYDENQLQRGLKVYTEVCAACHGLRYVAFRTLSQEGGPNLPEDQMRAYADTYEVWDPTLFDGDGDFRPARPQDFFPEGALSNAPDLSLMAKARAGFHGPYGLGTNQLFKGMGGPEYISALLQGYDEEPDCALEGEPMDGYYNKYFTAGGYPDTCKDEDGNYTVPGSWIAMAPPLWDDGIEYDDGHSASIEHQAEDVAAFLMWTAEPKLAARKQAGLTGVIFLTVLSVLLYLTNKRLWAPVKARAKGTKTDG